MMALLFYSDRRRKIMLEDIFCAMLGIFADGFLCGGLRLFGGVSHREGEACGFQEGDIVVTIPDGDHLRDIRAEHFCKGGKRISLACRGHKDLDIVFIGLHGAEPAAFFNNALAA